jgi:hypothetical protein
MLSAQITLRISNMETSLKMKERAEIEKPTATLSRFAVRVVDRRGRFKNIPELGAGRQRIAATDLAERGTPGH